MFPSVLPFLSGAQIERQRIQSLQDYAAKAPNIGFADNGSSGERDFTIRGVSNLGGFTRSNAVYVDEFNVTPGDVGSSLEQNLLDVERIEILRGPQGVFFGRNVIGGAVSITSKKPSNIFEASATAEYGSFNTGLFRGMINLPVTGDTVSVRLNGYGTKSDGYLKNISTGPDNGYRNWGLRGALRINAASNLTIDLSAQRNQLKSDNLDAVPTGEFLPALNLLRITQTVNSGEGFYPNNRRFIATNIPLATNNKNSQIMARVEWDLGTVKLIGVNGYIQNKASQIGDGDLSALNAYTDSSQSELKSYSTEWRVQSNDDGPLAWLLGASYADDSTSAIDRRTFQRGVPGPFAGFLNGRLPINRDTISNTKTLGIFANASYEIADVLTLSAGGRYSRDEVNNSFIDRDFFSGQGDVSEGVVKFNNISPRLSAVMKLNEAVNVYATMSRGYKPGGYNFSVDEIPGLPRSFGAETAWNYEGGIKGGTSDGVLQGSLSVFLLKWKNLQVNARQLVFLGGGAFTALDFVQNAEGATSKGAELSMTLKPTEGLTFSGGLGYNDAKFGSFSNAVDVDGLGSTTPNATSRAFDATGNTLPLAPRWTATASADYKAPVGDALTGFLGVSYSYKSLQFQDTTNRRTNELTGAALYRTQIPAYSNVALNAGIEAEKWTARVFINNVLNDNYYVGSRGAQSLTGTRVIVVPRSATFQFSIRY